MPQPRSRSPPWEDPLAGAEPEGDEGPRCSQLAHAAGEPLLGTAPQARVWVGVEQPGPWGTRPLTEPADSHLPGAVRELLTALDARSGAKVLLLRRPGRHPDPPGRHPGRQVLLAAVTPGHRFLVGATCRTDDELFALDLEGSARAALAGAVPAWGRIVPHPVALVCTNGRRDRCCAIAGRPVAAWLADRDAESVWECTHLGGHRFAPTSLVLPAGAAYGGLSGVDLLATMGELARARLPLPGLRGLTYLSAVQQVADAAVRSAVGLDGLDDTAPGLPRPESTDVASVEVTSPVGSHRVVVRTVGRAARSESCGREPVARWDLVPDATTG